MYICTVIGESILFGNFAVDEFYFFQLINEFTYDSDDKTQPQ